MNLSKMVATQKVLHDRIIKTHGLENEDLLPNTILALMVEVGELANEWRGFKHWSKDREPRTEGTKQGKTKDGLPARHIVAYNPLLEEYVDGLSFILELSLLFYKYDEETSLPIWSGNLPSMKIQYPNVVEQFNSLFHTIGYFADCTGSQEVGSYTETEEQFENIIAMYLGLGDMLGFTGEEIEQAYFNKNQINHVRQDEGY